MILKKRPNANIMGKGKNACIQHIGENAGIRHFLLFSRCFLPIPKRNSVLTFTGTLSSANVFNLDKSRNLLNGKQLK